MARLCCWAKYPTANKAAVEFKLWSAVGRACVTTLSYCLRFLVLSSYLSKLPLLTARERYLH